MGRGLACDRRPRGVPCCRLRWGCKLLVKTPPRGCARLGTTCRLVCRSTSCTGAQGRGCRGAPGRGCRGDPRRGRRGAPGMGCRGAVGKGCRGAAGRGCGSLWPGGGAGGRPGRDAPLGRVRDLPLQRCVWQREGAGDGVAGVAPAREAPVSPAEVGDPGTGTDPGASAASGRGSRRQTCQAGTCQLTRRRARATRAGGGEARAACGVVRPSARGLRSAPRPGLREAAGPGQRGRGPAARGARGQRTHRGAVLRPASASVPSAVGASRARRPQAARGAGRGRGGASRPRPWWEGDRVTPLGRGG